MYDNLMNLKLNEVIVLFDIQHSRLMNVNVRNKWRPSICLMVARARVAQKKCTRKYSDEIM